jgi:hypothetical protein
VGACTDKVKNGLETDVDCGGGGSCPRCGYARSCAADTDCQSGICVGGYCRVTSCKALKQEDPSRTSGPYYIAPDKLTAVRVYCDMRTDGGGWTVVSINGDLAQDTCRHRLRKDAPACGGTPDLSSDWQLAGNQMNLINFRELLLVAYESPGVFYAATRLGLSYTRTVATGVMSVTPTPVSNSPVACDPNQGTFAQRTKLAVTTDGYSAWGEDAGARACGANTGGINYNLGLNVITTAGTHEFHGFDDNDNGCGCQGLFLPADIGKKRGFWAVR